MSQHHDAIGWTGVARKYRPIFQKMLPMPCVKCGDLVYADEPWDLGHIEDIPVLIAQGIDPRDPHYFGPQHRRENRRSGGRVGQALQMAQKRALKAAETTRGSFPW